MSVFDGAIPAIIGAANAAGGGYEIQRSVRFNDNDAAYLNRTPSSAGNRKTWTWSGWAKRSSLSGNNFIFGAGSGIMASGAHSAVLFQSDSKIQVYDYSGSAYGYRFRTTKVFRDPSAWYHIVVAIDTTQSAQADRVKLYVNGDLQDSFDQTTYASLNYETYVNNSSTAHQIGHSNADTFDGYLADVHFIDGQALAATDFGEYDDNNVWQPKNYTNGFNDWFNTSQTWSGLWSGSVGYGSFANLHDTDFTNYMQSLNATLTLSSPITVTSLRILLQRYGATGTTLSINGTDESSQLPSAPSGLVWVDITGVTSLTSINVTSGDYSSNTLGLYAIEVNGKVLLDSGTSVANNGFYLKFSDNSSVAALGTDSSGNSNTWTVNNLSVTAGKDNDSLIDTPTNYEADSGNNGGNYCTLNPLQSATTLSNGNLDSAGGSGWSGTAGTFGMSSGKWYFEYDNVVSNEHILGIVPSTTYALNTVDAYAYGSETGGKYSPSASNVSYGASWTTGDVIGVAFDADNGNIYFYKNGTVQNSGTAAFTGLTSGPYLPSVVQNGSSRSASLNFGQRPFAYTPPTGYVSLCTTNLTDPTIADPSTAMDVKLWTGDGNTGRDITNYSFGPDLVWIKQRSATRAHALFDIVRGANKRLQSSSTSAETTHTDQLSAFLSNGFTIEDNNTVNGSSGTYVGWAWDAGTSNTTVAKDANGANLPGATCEYRANTTNGFSVVKVADPQSNEARVHGLGVAPDFFICKSTASADSWHTYWKVLGRSYYINLNATSPASSSDQFGSQEPDSTYFYVKANTGSGANKAGGMVYYLWNAVDQYSAFGEYEGNGNADGPFVFTGFKPKWIVFKMRSGSGDWRLMDTSRDLINPCDTQLYPNNTDAESSSSAHEVDYLSNGFKVVTSHSAMNTNGQYYLYAAFAEHPFKTSRAR